MPEQRDAETGGRLGVLAFGDSITNGGGELQWGVALQSWALWAARSLGLPYTGYAADGARVADVVGEQIPAFLVRTAIAEARYDVGCLYVGINDVRALDWDPAAFATDFTAALEFVSARCDRILVVTAPLRLGVPRCGAKVSDLNSIIMRCARERGALVVDLAALRARNLVMADQVHPTAFGQIAIAERALAVLERDGLAAKVAPASLINFGVTRRERLRGDLTYTYRSSKAWGRAAVILGLARLRADGERRDANKGRVQAHRR